MRISFRSAGCMRVPFLSNIRFEYKKDALHLSMRKEKPPHRVLSGMAFRETIILLLISYLKMASVNPKQENRRESTNY
jgi:hypothetical protein